ncbi:uncharacterized protein EI90DRAFT_3119621 [Cantharellus anzutake]|uniref:uncharacterized protein n=1 Tax=Cantharellus anzutake TaxID=1750568 RepID=UPI0019054C90|nr:uncharacterized protein EI90DRAFT_3119621 [Cantharellus anzutake]KAF8336326.1 hypothetical protein EI90DRAFT_3119621 [Cantharellus anzutake]
MAEDQPGVEHLPPPSSLTEQLALRQSGLRMSESPSMEATAVPSQANTQTGPQAALSPPVIHTPSLPGPTILPPLPVASPFGVRPASMLSMSLGSMPGTPAAMGSFPESGMLTPGISANAPSTTPVSPGARPLNVKDALSYLELVKVKFSDQPDVYNQFLDIMKDFKSQSIDTPGVIDRVSTLFTGHPSLIQGFNTFLPAGYRIECSQDGQDTNVIVTTPTGTTTTTAGSGISNLSRVASGAEKNPTNISNIPWASTSFVQDVNGSSSFTGPNSQSAPGGIPPVQPEFNHAIQFVNKIKNRFAQETETYKQFLEILQKYQKEQRPYQEVYQQVTQLFRNAPDLIEEFKQFLPDPSGASSSGGGLFSVLSSAREIDEGELRDKRKAGSGGVGNMDRTGAPAKRKRRVAEKEVIPPKGSQVKRTKHAHKADGDGPYGPGGSPGPSGVNGSGTNYSHQTQINGFHVPPAVDEREFFENVKKYIDDKPAYQDFIKLLNLFSQEIIDVWTLIDRVRQFLGDGDLFQQFKDLLGIDDRHAVEVEGGLKGVSGVVSALERPRVDLNKCRKYGPSYRKLPRTEAKLACSGRDVMCWEVLNDDWVSHPTWASEDTGFTTNKKNIYEEALHKSEEERHEYDFHIEAIVRTIQILEPIMARINLMDADERTHFKLKPGLGGQGKSIYQRVIKKVYGRDHGLEITQALHDSPSIAVPVVLNRLKQKDEEWKRAQREWNKVWREMDARNYYKSLDHQGVNFKVNDKKTVAAKQLVQDIEAKRKEQSKERAKLIDPSFARTLPKDHYAFKLDDHVILQDIVKLAISFLDRTSTAQFSRSDKVDIESSLRDFVPLFFVLNKGEFDASFQEVANVVVPVPPIPSVRGHEVESDAASDAVMEEGDDAVSVASNKGKASQKRGHGAVSGADLRKQLLKSGTQSRNPRKGTNSQTPSRASPAPTPAEVGAVDIEMKDSLAPIFATHNEPVPPLSIESDQLWVKYDSNDVEAKNASAFKPVVLETTARKVSFFANNAFYVLLRQIQVLYQRLYVCKRIAQDLASDSSGLWLANPTAVELGLHDTVGPGQSRLLTEGPNPAKHFYSFLLQCCEQLFDSQMDVNTFEDNLRFMFGTRAYLLFTVDKVIAAIIKQVQTIAADSKSQELLSLLRHERASTTFSNQQLISYRREAESIVGAEENVYRICWLVPSNIMQIQLLGKDDISTDDATTLTERWRHYIESYTLPHQTEGLPFDVKAPILKRSVSSDQDGLLPSSAYITRARLQIKICIRTYRLFFVGGTEDFYWRRRSDEDIRSIRSETLDRKPQKKAALDKWLDAKISAAKSNPGDGTPSFTTAPTRILDAEPSVKPETSASEDVEMLTGSAIEADGKRDEAEGNAAGIPGESVPTEDPKVSGSSKDLRSKSPPAGAFVFERKAA